LSEDLVKRYDKGNMHVRKRKRKRERKGVRGEREARSKLGTATGNFSRDGEIYG
jgi:hypothetical protein